MIEKMCPLSKDRRKEIAMSRKLISEIQFGKRVRQDPGDIDSLAKSIERWGLLQPVLPEDDPHLGQG
jgi:hypothetical protein